MEMHVERERHPDLLNEILEIPNIEKMTDYDLFTAAGGCLLALESQQVEQMIERQKFDNPIDDFYWERTY
jgi:elongation factor P--beta-lysine ligase